MIKIPITKEHINEAKKLYDFGVLNGSITAGEGNKRGAIGEVIAREFLDAKQENTYDYDIVYKGKKIDVKTKKYTYNLTPNRGWNLNIPDFNTTQKCDYYLFIGMSTKYDVAYFYGFIPKEDFYKIAIFGKKGTQDPSTNVPFVFTSDCYNIQISRLKIDIN